MAVQKTPHTNTEQNVTSAAMDLEPNQSPLDVGRGEDAKIYENNAGAQTGGNRAFHANDRRDNLPKSFDEGTRLQAENTREQRDDHPGVTTHNAAEERERQQKVEQNNS